LTPEHAALARQPLKEAATEKPAVKNGLAKRFPELVQTLLKAIGVWTNSARAEQVYLQWVELFYHFHRTPQQQSLTSCSIESFIEHLSGKPNLCRQHLTQVANVLQ
jgi:hypothetical protein